MNFDYNGSAELSKEIYLYRGKTAPIILEALQTLGLNLGYLTKLLGLPASTELSRFEEINLDCFEWLAICEALYLSVDVISLGYNRRWHLGRIQTALNEGYFHLRRTPTIRQLARELKRHQKQNLQFMNQCYGLRLRWRIRIGNFLGSIRSRLNPNRYDPTAHAKEIAQMRQSQNTSVPPPGADLTRKILTQTLGEIILHDRSEYEFLK